MINKKRTGFIVLGLAALSLGTIGFSSWIISGIDGTVNNKVNVKVGDVKDQRLTCELVAESQELNLNFDAKKGVSGEVITADPTQKEDEDLTFGFSFRIYAATEESYATAISGKGVYLKFTTDNANFKNAVSSGYILSPIAFDDKEHEETEISSMLTSEKQETPIKYGSPDGAKDITRLTYSIEDYTDVGKSGKTVKLTYSFAWGAVFKFKNPVELSSSDFSANDNAAKTALDAIDAIDDTDLKLNVTLTVK